MSLISNWQGYAPPNYRVSQSAAYFVRVKPSFYMPAPHGGSQNKKAPSIHPPGATALGEPWPP